MDVAALGEEPRHTACSSDAYRDRLNRLRPDTGATDHRSAHQKKASPRTHDQTGRSETQRRPTALNNWENGGTILRLDHRKSIAVFIGMDEDRLDDEMSRAWNDAHGKLTE